MMSDIAVTIGIVAVVLVGMCAILVFAIGATVDEAERKLGRELTFGEMVFGAVALPYSALYVWWVMAEPTKSRRPE